jgi:hypothetical protein
MSCLHQALAKLMPKALELYKNSDVHKRQIASRAQNKQQPDELLTTEDKEKKVNKAQQILAAEAKKDGPRQTEGKSEGNGVREDNDEEPISSDRLRLV